MGGYRSRFEFFAEWRHQNLINQKAGLKVDTSGSTSANVRLIKEQPLKWTPRNWHTAIMPNHWINYIIRSNTQHKWIFIAPIGRYPCCKPWDRYIGLIKNVYNKGDNRSSLTFIWNLLNQNTTGLNMSKRTRSERKYLNDLKHLNACI